MSGPSTYIPKSGLEKWIDQRLPLPRHARFTAPASDHQSGRERQVLAESPPPLRHPRLQRMQPGRAYVVQAPDFQRVATRDDKLARNDLSPVLIAATCAYWRN